MTAQQTEASVARHYTHGGLEAALRGALAASGKDLAALAPDDLAPVDEFHIGGREATERLAGLLEVAPGMHLLDIGCGIGGAARYFASAHGAQVTGIDLTQEYVAVATALADWVGLADRVAFRQGSALDLPFENAAFDGAYTLHVGMNIEDKGRLIAEAARTLKPGGRLGIYDVMRVGEGALAYPVPWAADEATSFLGAVDEYRAGLAAAGLEIVAEENRRAFAIAFFEDVRRRTQAQGGPPPLGTHILVGADAPEKFANMARNLAAGLIAPVEIIARKPD